MRHLRRTTLMLLAMTCAISLVANSNVQAGNGWEWQKPINQRLGAFYTLNKAFKQPRSSSRSYHRSPSYSAQAATPTYQVLPAQTKVIQPGPRQQVHVQVQSVAQIQSVQGQIRPVPVQAQASSIPTLAPSFTPTTVAPTVASVAEESDTNSPVDTDQDAIRSAVEQALELLEAESAVGQNAPTTVSAPGTENKGAVRMVSPSLPGTEEPLPFQSTTDAFWE